jgi:hypothetical protein
MNEGDKVFALVKGVLVTGIKTHHTPDAILIKKFPEHPEAGSGFSFAGNRLARGEIFYADEGTMHLLSELQ